MSTDLPGLRTAIAELHQPTEVIQFDAEHQAPQFSIVLGDPEGPTLEDLERYGLRRTVCRECSGAFPCQTLSILAEFATEQGATT